MCFTLKGEKKELEREIEKLQRKLEIVNAKLAKKEAKKQAKLLAKQGGVAPAEEEVPVVPAARETVENAPTAPSVIAKHETIVEQPVEVVAEPVAEVAPAKRRGRPRKVVVEPVAEVASVAEPVVAKKPEAKKETPKSTETPRYMVRFDDAKNKWIIKKSGADRIIASYFQKEDAVKRGKELARNNAAVLSVQRKDGKFGKL